MLSEPGQQSSNYRLQRRRASGATLRAGLWITAAAAAAYLLIRVDTASFRVDFDRQLVRVAEASTHRVDNAFRRRSEALQARLLSLASPPELAGKIAKEVLRLRRQGDFARLTLVDPEGNVIRPDRPTEGQRLPPPRSFLGSLRRAGMLGDPGLEIRHLPVSRIRGAPVLIGLGPADLLVGHYWQTTDLYAEVDEARTAIETRSVALAVLNDTGELMFTTPGSEAPPLHPVDSLHLAGTTLATFPGWRLAALPAETDFESVVRARQRRSTALGTLIVGLAAIVAARWHRADRGHVRTPPQSEESARQVLIGQALVRLDRFEAQVSGSTQPLSAREVDLLCVLLEHRGEIVRREDLLARVWGYASDVETRTLDTFIYRLRRKLEPDPTGPQHLQTVRGVGYKLADG
ncbi:MAG: helix-turn-helix domain-containing protein [Acidobacteriota bacterium]